MSQVKVRLKINRESPIKSGNNNSKLLVDSFHQFETEKNVEYKETETKNKNIRGAIDFLLGSESKTTNETPVVLTECSPEIDVVINKNGGICTKCNIMFKSRVSLINHMEKCS